MSETTTLEDLKGAMEGRANRPDAGRECGPTEPKSAVWPRLCDRQAQERRRARLDRRAPAGPDQRPRLKSISRGPCCA